MSIDDDTDPNFEDSDRNSDEDLQPSRFPTLNRNHSRNTCRMVRSLSISSVNEKDDSDEEREHLYTKYSSIFEKWIYSDDERKWLKWRVETLTREQAVFFCILGHILMSTDEMSGPRTEVPSPEEAKQALLKLTLGSQWDVKNAAIILAFADKINGILKSYDGVRDLRLEQRSSLNAILRGQLGIMSDSEKKLIFRDFL